MERPPTSNKESISSASEKISDLRGTRTETRSLTLEGSPEQIEAVFTVENFSALNPMDIGPDDRAYVHTASGNVYRIERSKTRSGLLKVWNQNTGGNLEYAAKAPGKSAVIKVGESMFYAQVANPDNLQAGHEVVYSSNIAKIEIWRNLVKAHDDLERKIRRGGAGFGGIGQALAAEASGRREMPRDYTKK